VSGTPPPHLAASDTAHSGPIAELADAVRPRLRGWLHAGMTPIVLAAGIVLIALAPSATARIATIIYTVCGLALFATSGVYHRRRWGARAHAWLRRADHGNVYLLIAGTYTPVVVLALTGAARTSLLWVIWIGAALGVGFRFLWPGAPRSLYTVLYVALGWSLAPELGELLHSSGVAVFALTLAGGVLYTVGALIYAAKRPDPAPRWFGFHELFHACTVAAWVCQYIAISVLVYRQR
jgi:hemolysin III